MNEKTEAPASRARALFLVTGVIAMGIVVTASNILVEMPINDWLTWGALSYPFAFLVTDLTNRALGAGKARIVVLVGFLFAVVMSLLLADARIAVASGAAFLIAQLLDVFLFDRLRQATWWKAPVFSSVIASFVDTLIFFILAFAGTGLPWETWALGDYGVKIFMVAVLILPFRGLLKYTDPLTLASTAR
ncbi:queuosine precursor transporter [Sneathiella chinensis]|uniref:Probable queuosine precursor transporter n=1 Tax=Sneathiella chinensis TaxID=349750 RepID=A0ABQ5U251_9PROT|nr:queuosine precursor transporter [Sneathiella chinensis]GLQ05427.1 membrane protein [Sneathiella chinensis]